MNPLLSVSEVNADGAVSSSPPQGDPGHAVLICLLGPFRVLKAGHPVDVRNGGKWETLLTHMALRLETGMTRESLLALLWPDGNPALATESLNSLMYRLHRCLGDALAGAGPIMHAGGRYRINVAAGVGVDVTQFENLARTGQEYCRIGDFGAAFDAFDRATLIYRGDLSAGSDVHAVMERERLRDVYSTLLSRLAEHHFVRGEYGPSAERALAILTRDPCREDIHRLIMRCYARLGKRAQALRQFRLCASMLSSEFDAVPEPATLALFEQLRLTPSSV
jgi:DNA-binding SARP family transcriptional activator